MFPMYLGIYLRKILWSPCTFRGILPWNVPTLPRNFPKEDPQVAMHFSYRYLLLPKENPKVNPYVALHFPKVLGFLTTDCPKVVKQFYNNDWTPAWWKGCHFVCEWLVYFLCCLFMSSFICFCCEFSCFFTGKFSRIQGHKGTCLQIKCSFVNYSEFLKI